MAAMLRIVVVLTGIALAVWLALAPVNTGWSSRSVSPDVAEALARFRAQRLSSAHFDASDRVPGLPFGPVTSEAPWPAARRDVHAAIEGYTRKRCVDCHAEPAQDVHTTRGNLTCRQCHGAGAIASLHHYFSPMNPIRRHAYVCAKCHEGASASFATYVVHVPHTASAMRERFPALYWTDRFMLVLIVGVLVVFVPHGIAWWVREWFVRRRKIS